MEKLIKDFRGNALFKGDKVSFVIYNELALGEVVDFTSRDNIKILIDKDSSHYNNGMYRGYYTDCITRPSNCVIKL